MDVTHDDYYGYEKPKRAPRSVGRRLLDGISAVLRWSGRALWVVVRGLWRGFAAVLGWTWAATVWTARLPFRLLGWFFGLFQLRPLDFQNDYYGAMERLIRRRFRRRRWLVTHLFIGGGFSAVLLVDTLILIMRSFSPSFFYTQRLSFIMIWMGIFLFHYVRVRMADAEDDAIRAMAEAAPPHPRLATDEADAPRRNRLREANEDGELLYYDFNEDGKIKRR